jgi:ABC-type branched-subunit amino acid transport system ATPase component
MTMDDTRMIPRPSANGAPLLEVRGLTKRFAGVVALNQVDMEIHPCERVSLIGPNGSGKTTMFNCITGFYRSDEGSVRYKGVDITHERPDKIALRGITRTFQNVRVFPSLSVTENLMVSLQQHQEEHLVHRFLHTGRIREFDKIAAEKAEDCLGIVGLSHLKDEKAAGLVYGQRKLLEFACALISNPDLIMLDEPAAGVSTAMVDQMKRHIMDVNRQGKAFLIVEHNLGMVMDISERIIFLDYGVKIAEGTPAAIQGDQRVREAYFGR